MSDQVASKCKAVVVLVEKNVVGYYAPLVSVLRNALLLVVFFIRSITFSVASLDSIEPEVIMDTIRRSSHTCFKVSSSSRSSSLRVPLR